MDSGVLSGFVAEPGDAFYGGPEVRALEREWCERFEVKHAVSMNSATSCLFAAVRALGIGPGDEVIVSPWTMSASVSCVVAVGAVPVFADIEPDTFGLDPDSVVERITSRTKAIIVVDLFGCPAQMVGLDLVGIPIIEDAAQAPGASYYGFHAGTCGTIGVYSLNCHKTIQCGEGGIAVTDDDELACQLRLLRNHGEAVGASMIGQNYRMTELQAAIARVQLERLDELTRPRVRNAWRLNDALEGIDGVEPPITPSGYRHVFYLYAVRVRDAWRFAKMLRAEGVPASQYVEPLYRLSAFVAYPADCPVVEQAYGEVVVHPLVHARMTDADLQDVIDAFRKVSEQL